MTTIVRVKVGVFDADKCRMPDFEPLGDRDD